MDKNNKGIDFNWDILIYVTIILLITVLLFSVFKKYNVVSELADSKSNTHNVVVTTDKDNSKEPVPEITTVASNS